MLDVRNLSVHFDRQILNNVSFHVNSGEIMSIVGPSGCGKSTLMRAIVGLVESTGTISIDGTDVTAERIENRPVALVSQTPALFESMTVWDNVAFGLDDPAMSDAQRNDLVNIALVSLNILHIGTSKPGTLSGGQRGRVALARALVRRPQVLLLDEPLAHVDDARRFSIRRDIIALARRLGISVLYVTHDIDEAFMVSDRLMIIVDGEVRQLAEPREIYRRCADLDVARIVGHTNVYPVTVKQSGAFATIQCGSRMLTSACHPDVTVGPAALVVPSDHVSYHRSSRREVYGKTGQIMSRISTRFYDIVDIETEIGTVTSVSPSDIDAGEMVDLHFEDTWVLPRGAEPSPQ